MATCNDKFWTESVSTLFNSKCGINFIPSVEMSLEQKMNAATRLVFVIFLILLLFDVKLSLLFLLAFSVVIIILYYYQKMKLTPVTQYAQQTRENYVNTVQKPLSAASFRVKYNNENIFLQNDKVVVNSPSIYRFCDDEVPLGVNNPNYVSANQRLVGQPNPKTKIPPVMAPPCMDLDYWKANNLVVFSHINAQTQEDAYQSGFQESTCCQYLNDEYIDPNPVSQRVTRQTEDPFLVKENFDVFLKENEGGVDTACGYNPKQIYTSNLPSNIATGRCQRNSELQEYNDNLFTQIIEPNIYYKNEVNEPTNANMGISFTQQFEPTTCSLRNNTSTHIIARDPLVIEPNFHEDEEDLKPEVSMANVYDPRFAGYGTSYRSYIEPTTGQPRFAYDDVNAIRMPNYIARSNIDHLSFADSYGPLPKGGAYGNEFNAKIKALANDAFTRDTVEYRTGLQQRLMRKVNTQAWQQRVAPIRTSGQYMSGGMSCH